MFGTHFDHKTIRIYNTVFGSLFNNIDIIREDGKVIPIPIAFGTGAKHFLLKRDNEGKEREIAITMPRMSFNLEAMNHDIARQGNKTGILQNDVNTQYNRVPYDFIYTLSIKTKTIDEGHQILEQILPYFTPILNIKVKDSADLNIVSTIPIRLDSVSPIDTYEGSLEEGRELTWDLSFNLKGWIYQQTKTGVPIKTVFVNIDDYTTPFQTVTLSINPPTAKITDQYTIDETITDI